VHWSTNISWASGLRLQVSRQPAFDVLTWYAMPVCDIIMVSTISRMLCAVVAVVIIILNVRWWLWVEIDRYIGWYLDFTDISVSAKTADIIGLSRCWQNAVIFLTHPDNLHEKAQWTKSRQFSCSNASRCIFINKQTRWTMEHVSAIAAETKASSLTLWEPGYDIFVLWFQPKTAVFGCLTNAQAPPSIALESCSRAQTDRPA